MVDGPRLLYAGESTLVSVSLSDSASAPGPVFALARSPDGRVLVSYELGDDKLDDGPHLARIPAAQ